MNTFQPARGATRRRFVRWVSEKHISLPFPAFVLNSVALDQSISTPGSDNALQNAPPPNRATGGATGRAKSCQANELARSAALISCEAFQVDRAADVDSPVKVLRVDGRLPDDNEYRLRIPPEAAP